MGYRSFETVFCHTSQILSRFYGRIAPRPRPTISPKSTPQKGKETFGHLSTSDKFNPSLLNQRIHQLSKSDVVSDTIAEECKPIHHKPAQGPFLLGNTAKQRENTGDYARVKLAQIMQTIGVGAWYGARGLGVGAWYDTRTQTKERDGRKNAPDERECDRVRGAIAFARWRAHAHARDGERTRARGPRRRTRRKNRAGGTRKRAPSALHSPPLYLSESMHARGAMQAKHGLRGDVSASSE